MTTKAQNDNALKRRRVYFENHPFRIGQPLFILPSEDFAPDIACYVAIGFSRGFCQGWMAEVVRADDPDAFSFLVPCKWLTDTNPWHYEIGTSRRTATGTTLMEIKGS
jgi:hypothetical protein